MLDHNLNMDLAADMARNGYPTLPAYTVGVIARFAAPGKPKSNRAAYLCVYQSGVAIYGDFITGAQFIFCANGRQMTNAEKKSLYEDIQRQRREAEQDRLKLQRTKANEAESFCQQCQPAPAGFVYLVQKGIKPNGALFDAQERVLVLPIIGLDGEFKGQIQSYQTIDAQGQKRFMSGAKKSGGAFKLQHRPDAPIVICEGFATGCSLAEHFTPDYSVFVAFDSANLLPVATAIRKHNPRAKIIIAADNDHLTELTRGFNPGKEAALKAAQAVGGSVSMPHFEPDELGSDWNDRLSIDQWYQRQPGLVETGGA